MFRDDGSAFRNLFAMHDFDLSQRKETEIKLFKEYDVLGKLSELSGYLNDAVEADGGPKDGYEAVIVNDSPLAEIHMRGFPRELLTRTIMSGSLPLFVIFSHNQFGIYRTNLERAQIEMRKLWRVPPLAPATGRFSEPITKSWLHREIEDFFFNGMKSDRDDTVVHRFNSR